MEVWVLEHADSYEPAWIKGVYSTEEGAKAAVPEVEDWASDGRVRFQAGVRAFYPMWTITPYALDVGSSDE